MRCAWQRGCEQTADVGATTCVYHRKVQEGLIGDVGLEPTAPSRWPTVETLERERRKKVRRRARQFDRLLAADAKEESR